LAQDPGVLELPGARLRYAYATRWSEGFATERIGLDRVDACVRGAARTLDILPLPEEGRPGDFCGAVGRLELRGEASAREVELGGSLKLSLHLTGEANFESFDPPRLAHVEGWRVGGIIDHRSGVERTFEVDLAPLDARVTRIPEVAFSFFDTTPPASYRTLRTAPIPVVVRGPEQDSGDGAATPDGGKERSRGLAAASLAALAAILVLVTLWVFARRSSSAR
ncbi:MAG TPA: hypothetical protein VM509_09055, partial [Planctomycetota bacterium]|nr:hypothetical protein [Planctomycetota bacterium]